MKEKNVAMETDSIKEHDFTIWEFQMVNDDKNLGIFILEFGGIGVRGCRCFYTPGGDFQIRLPPSIEFAAELPFERFKHPHDRIKELLLAEIDRVKAEHFDDDIGAY
jgi:hypothetical protein